MIAGHAIRLRAAATYNFASILGRAAPIAAPTAWQRRLARRVPVGRVKP